MDGLLDWVVEPDAGWSVGTFGALAGFLRDPDEPAAVVRAPGRASVVTPRGGIAVAVTDDVRPVAWERGPATAGARRSPSACCRPADGR